LAKTAKSLTHLALHKFKNNLWGVLSFYFILLCALIAIFAYVLAPDKSANANQMHLSIHSMSPGFSVKMLKIPEEIEEENSKIKQLFYGKKSIGEEIPITDYVFKEEELAVELYTREGLETIHREFIISENFPAELSIEEIENQFIYKKTFLLGTDKYGRDFLSRILIGTRISLFIGFIAVLISLVIGITLGALAGFYGGKVDNFIMWLINVTWSIPTLLLVIAMTLALGKGFWQVFIAVGLTMWVEVARVVRGQVMGVKELQYITAAKALGYKNLKIITQHILPNVMAPVIVISAANFASAILVESGLSFLGIGAQPPIPSWGAMIKEHYSYIVLGKAYLAIIPGLAIMSLVLAFMLIGNALRDALDVKT